MRQKFQRLKERIQKILLRFFLGLQPEDCLAVINKDGLRFVKGQLKEDQKREIFNILMKDMYHAVSEHDLISLRPGKKFQQILIGGKEISEVLTNNIVSEARLFLKSDFYDKVMKSIPHILNKSMFNTSKSDNDIFFGKAALWWQDIFDRTLREIAKIGS